MSVEQKRLKIEQSWSKVCQALGCTVREYHRARIHLSPTIKRGGSFYNCFLKLNASDADAGSIIDWAMKRFKEHNLPYSFYLPTTDQADPYVRVVEDFGASLHQQESFMILHELKDSVRTNPEVEVVRVDDKTLDEYTAVTFAAFGWPEAIREAKRRALRRALSDKRMLFYLGYMNNKAVGATFLYSDGRLGSINEVATLKEYRGSGVATTVVSKAIMDSKERGDELAWLKTVKGSEAERLYSRIGFETIYHGSVYRAKDIH